MKKVIDAVNHYKAEYPEKYDVGFIFCGERILRCGFNRKVEELSHHKGIELFNEYVKADKKLLEKESKDKISCYVCNIGAYPMQQYCGNCGHELLSELIPPKPSTVFTQEMSDNGDLPPIGSKAQFVGNDDYLVEFSITDGDEIECICHTTDFEGESIGVYRHKDGYSVSILTQLIKPIDTRTDKEKAIDELHSKFPYKTGGQLLSLAYDKWVGK